MFEVRRLILLKPIEAGVSPASSNKTRTREQRTRRLALSRSCPPRQAEPFYAARFSFLVILSEVEDL